MSATRLILELVARNPDIQAHVISLRVGITRRSTSRLLSKLHKELRISRHKNDSSYYAYYLTADQLHDYESKYATRELLVPTVDIPARLRYLRKLWNTAHNGNPLLSAIIKDYERTLRHHQSLSEKVGNA